MNAQGQGPHYAFPFYMFPLTYDLPTCSIHSDSSVYLSKFLSICLSVDLTAPHVNQSTVLHPPPHRYRSSMLSVIVVYSVVVLTTVVVSCAVSLLFMKMQENKYIELEFLET